LPLADHAHRPEVFGRCGYRRQYLEAARRIDQPLQRAVIRLQPVVEIFNVPVLKRLIARSFQRVGQQAPAYMPSLATQHRPAKKKLDRGDLRAASTKLAIHREVQASIPGALTRGNQRLIASNRSADHLYVETV
jgi:hypothetical protein